MLFATSCTSGPQLKKYPRTQIDRPFTLPKGVASWDLTGLTYHDRNIYGDSRTVLLPNPLVWQQALTDDWQLTWTPIPLVLRKQLNYDESGFTGLILALGGDYSSYYGVTLKPIVGLKTRNKLTPTFAINTQISWSPIIPLGRGDGFEWRGGIGAEAYFQVSPLIALSVGPSLNFDNSAIFQYKSFLNLTYLRTDLRTTVPLATGFHWSFDRQWDFDLNYTLNYIGEPNGVYRHSGYFQFVHFW